MEIGIRHQLSSHLVWDAGLGTELTAPSDRSIFLALSDSQLASTSQIIYTGRRDEVIPDSYFPLAKLSVTPNCSLPLAISEKDEKIFILASWPLHLPWISCMQDRMHGSITVKQGGLS